MTRLDWAIVLVLNGAIIAYGFRFARRTASSSDWFLGGRKLPWWGLGLSMFATSVDNADFVSLTGHVYNNGVHILTVFSLAAVLGACFAAFCIVPVLYRANVYTNAEFLEARFDPSLRLFSALIQIQYRTAVLGLMIWSIYLMLNNVVGLSPWQAWSVICLLVLLTASYTMLGGLASVVWTDALQSVIIIAAGICIFVSVGTRVGGYRGFQERLAAAPPLTWNERYGWVAEQPPSTAGASTTGSLATGETDHKLTQPLSHWLRAGRFHNPSQDVSPYLLVLGWVIIGLVYYTVNHTQTMRLLGARSLWDMKMAALIGAALGIPVILMTVLLGVLGRLLYPELTAHGESADVLFPRLVNDYLAPGFKGLVVAGVVSAAISTFDSMGSALSALFTRDVYARWIKPSQTDQHYLSVGRWATFGVLLVGFLYIPFIVHQRNMVDATLKLIPVFTTPLFTVYLLGAMTRVHRRSGLIGLVIGGSYGLLGLIDREIVSFGWTPPLFFEQWYSYPFSILITASVMLLATPLLNRKYPPVPDHLATSQGRVPWLKDSREHLPSASGHPFASGVPFALEPRWFAAALILVALWLVFVRFW